MHLSLGKLGAAVRPGGTLSPVAALVLGAGAYLLLAAVVEVGVIRRPDGNRFLHIALLTLLGLAFVAAADGFLAVIRAISPREMLRWPFRAAAAGSVAYSLAYGHRAFVNYWYYDDWGYLLQQPLDKGWIVGPINDHFVPLLKILLWGTVRVFGFDYVGAACLQQAAFLVIVLVLAHLLWSATRRPWILILLVGLFAAWPSYGMARTWFGGGFWLTASTALLSMYVLHSRRIVFAETMRLTEVAVSVVLAAATVFISSQTLAPGVYIAAFCAPALLLSQRRNVGLRRLGILCAISLAPTAVALWGRSVYAVSPPLNPSGLFDGRLIVNLGFFILTKILFVNSYTALALWLTPLVLAALFVLLATAAKKLTAPKVIDLDRRAGIAGLILGGGAVFVLPLVQIGLARRWSYDAVLTPYYVTLPLLGLWLALAGIGVALTYRPEDRASAHSRKSVAVAVATVIAAGGLSGSLQPYEPPLALRLQRIHLQRQFIDGLGAAVCDLAVLHRNGPAVRWVPGYDLANCRVCQDIIGPPRFLHDLGFGALVRIAARRSCPAADLTGVWPTGSAAQSAAVTDGTESEAAMSFVRRYLAPLNHTIAPP